VNDLVFLSPARPALPESKAEAEDTRQEHGRVHTNPPPLQKLGSDDAPELQGLTLNGHRDVGEHLTSAPRAPYSHTISQHQGAQIQECLA
jgi:hypothetical protein